MYKKPININYLGFFRAFYNVTGDNRPLGWQNKEKTQFFHHHRWVSSNFYYDWAFYRTKFIKNFGKYDDERRKKCVQAKVWSQWNSIASVLWLTFILNQFFVFPWWWRKVKVGQHAGCYLSSFYLFSSLIASLLNFIEWIKLT